MAGKIDADDFVPLRECHLIDRRIRLQSGVVDQNVDGTELLADGAEHPGDVVFTRDVGFERHRGMTMAAQLVDHGLRFVLAGDVIDTNIRPGVTERECDGASDPGARPGDNCFLPFEQFAVFGFRRTGFGTSP